MSEPFKKSEITRDILDIPGDLKATFLHDLQDQYTQICTKYHRDRVLSSDRMAEGGRRISDNPQDFRPSLESLKNLVITYMTRSLLFTTPHIDLMQRVYSLPETNTDKSQWLSLLQALFKEYFEDHSNDIASIKVLVEFLTDTIQEYILDARAEIDGSDLFSSGIIGPFIGAVEVAFGLVTQ